LIQDDDELQNMTDEKKQEIISALEDHRQLKRAGVRASNRAAAQDVHLTIEKINAEVLPQ
jgi:hypothetical protein